MARTPAEWVSHHLFRLVHKNNLVYNSCWEDPRLDREAMKITKDDRIAMITSAGCNALDYALDNPASIDCIDVNPRQNALLELKIAGIKALGHNDFFSLFGMGFHPNFKELYRKQLRGQLSESSKLFWDKNTSYFRSRSSRSSFYYRGTSGQMARALSYYIDANKLRRLLMLAFDTDNLQEQAKLYYDYIRPRFWNRPLKWVMGLDATLSLLGVPRPQRYQVEQTFEGGISTFMESCIESVFTSIPLKDNYFWWLYINGHYTKDRCPEYLKEENFYKLKDGAVDKIETHTTTLLEFFKHSEEKISRFVLLDHMDWLNYHDRSVLCDEWQAMIDKATPDAMILWRSGGMEVDFVDDIEIYKNGKSRQLGEVLNYQTDLAEELHKKDRVRTYGSFYIAGLADSALGQSAEVWA